MNAIDTTNSLSILYIEDNHQNQRLVSSIMAKKTRHTLHLADTGQAGLDSTSSLNPDLILLDINLPDMSGYEVLKTLKSNSVTQHIPVIAITANATNIDYERAQKEDFYNYITKPFNITDFLAAIKIDKKIV